MIAFSSSASANGDVLDGGEGSDKLVNGDGPDIFSGGSGSDLFQFEDDDALYDVAGNTAFEDETSPALNFIKDFVSGTDKLTFLASSFGSLATGNLANGTSFSVINDSYAGTNAGTNQNHASNTPTFIYSTEDNVLFYDANGANAGYQAVATVGQPGSNDIEMVATV